MNVTASACITALTVQSTQGVRRVEAVDPQIIAATLRELVSDVGRGSRPHRHAGERARRLRWWRISWPRRDLPHVVLDPILKSSSGADLLDAAGTRLLIERLLPLV